MGLTLQVGLNIDFAATDWNVSLQSII